MQSKFMKAGRGSPRALFVPLFLILSSFALGSPASAVNVALVDGANVANPSKLAMLPPDPLLSVDLNRNEIVSKLVARWRTEATDSQLDSLKARLAGLRADRLLAVALVGSFDGVLKVLDGQEKADQVTVARRDGQKALGDANVDLVYTPLTPCRLFDTRTGQISTLGTVGGIFNPNTRRTISPAGNCGVPASGIRSLVMGLTTRNSTPGSGGYIAVVAPAAGISATVDIFNLGSEWSATNIIAPTSGSGQFDVFVSTATADVVMDIVGYFAAPPQPIGTVTGITAGSGLTGGTVTTSGTITVDPAVVQLRVSSTCAAGTFITAVAANGTVTCAVAPAGATGATGPTGAVGPAGPAGAAGATGAAGPQGTQGPAGAVGAAGPQGPAGPVGATGAAGPQGPVGATGAAGPQGTQGPAGAVGAAGPIGPAGAVGAAGPQGPQGPVGATGATGSAGLVSNPFASTVNTVDSAGNVGQYTSITLGADGLPVISYFDATIADLKVAKCINAACTGASTVTTVDSAGDVGQYTSITVGADGLPVISYFDLTNGRLKVAKCINAACTGASTLTTVDSAGGYTSITLGADGLPVISYYNSFSKALKVAKCINAACTGASTLTTVQAAGSVGTVGQHTSITLGADGLPVISYYDQANGALTVAKCANAACTGASSLATVDSTGDVGQYTSITLGADELPVISYYDFTNSALKLAKCTNAACNNSIIIRNTVDNVGTVGQFTSITLGADGLPIISYYDQTNGYLKVAKCTSANCVPFVRRR